MAKLVPKDVCKEYVKPQEKDVGGSAGFSEQDGAAPGFAEKGGGAGAMSERTGGSGSFSEADASALAFAEKDGEDVSFSEAGADGVAFAEQGASAEAYTEQDGTATALAEQSEPPEPALDQRAEWDWVDVGKFCDNLGFIGDSVIGSLVRISRPNQLNFAEALVKSIVVAFGDNATPSDTLGLKGETGLGATILFSESEVFSDTLTKLATKVEGESVAVPDDAAIAPVHVVLDTFDQFSEDSVIVGIPVILDGPYFLYGHGGYGQAGYGGVNYLPIIDEMDYTNVTFGPGESVAVPDSREVYWLPVIISEDVIL